MESEVNFWSHATEMIQKSILHARDWRLKSWSKGPTLLSRFPATKQNGKRRLTVEHLCAVKTGVSLNLKAHGPEMLFPSFFFLSRIPSTNDVNLRLPAAVTGILSTTGPVSEKAKTARDNPNDEQGKRNEGKREEGKKVDRRFA